jgi:capsular exopolysaccharide synthesis family protein
MSTTPVRAHHTHKAGLHPTEYLRVLYKRRWVAIPGFLLIFLTGAIDSVRTVPIYEARTQLLIEKDARRATSLNSVLEERTTWYEDDFYPTQQRILQSRMLAENTVDALHAKVRPEQVPAGPSFSLSIGGLWRAASSGVRSLFAAPAPPTREARENADAAARAAAVGRFLGGLNVVPIRNSRLVDLKFRSPDPEYATWAVNELAKQYIQQSIRYRHGASIEASEYLQQQLDEQRKKVESADRRLQDYKVQHNAVSVDDKQNIVAQKYNDLSQQLTTAKIELMSREAEYQGLTKLRASGGAMDSYPSIAGDELVVKLKTDIAAIEAQRAAMASTWGPKSDEMKQIDQRLATAKTQLDDAVAKKVLGIQTERERASMNVASLESALRSHGAEVLGLNSKALEYNALEREAESERKLYDTLLQRTNEIGVSQDFKGTNIQVIDTAQVPGAPVLPQVRRDLMTAAAGGIGLALLLAFVFEYFDSRVKSPEEIKAHFGLPFLGIVPVSPEGEGGVAPLLEADQPGAFGEAIRSLRTGVLFSSADEGSRALIVTSTGPSEGKTVIASNLAITLARAGQRTIVVDADMRRPRLHAAVNRGQEPGLSNVLVGDTSLADATTQTAVANLWVLPAGHIPPNPAELLGSHRFADLMKDLKSKYDWIIIDAPPVMPVTDSAVLAHSAGSVLFVIGSEMTPRQTALTAVEQLRSVNAKFVGAVLNRVNVERHSYYYRAYYRKEYGKYYQRSAHRA